MRKILLTAISLFVVAALVGCGGSNSSSSTTTPPSGGGGNPVGFSISSLKGTYVFSDIGINSVNVNFAVAGFFVADGAGNISSGAEDYFDDSGVQIQNETLTGTYTVSADGRGQLNLTQFPSGEALVYRFVMQSPGAASFFQVSNSAEATGRIQLQSAVNGSALAGKSTYVIRLDGEDNGKNIYGAVGALTINSTSISGTVDQNDDGLFSPLLTAVGSDFEPNANGRGTLSFTVGGINHDFVYYWVSPSHIELVGSDANFWLHGYADLQTAPASSNAALSGGQVIALSGINANSVLIENARLTLDGNGGINSGVEDHNQSGSYTANSAFAGTYAVSTTGSGRWTASIVDVSSNLVGWQVSPRQSVVLAYNSANSLTETGTMRAQSTNIASLTNAGISGEYAENMSGKNLNLSGYVEVTANFHADGAGNLSGTLDTQTPSSFNAAVSATGVYSTNSNGRGAGTIAGVPVVIYFVDADTMYLISSDGGLIYQGKMVMQQP
jgi:hypothetical protein